MCVGASQSIVNKLHQDHIEEQKQALSVSNSTLFNFHPTILYDSFVPCQAWPPALSENDFSAISADGLEGQTSRSGRQDTWV